MIHSAILRRQSAAPRNREAGLTLIELMISMFLAVLLTGGLFYMMSGQQKTYNQQLSTMAAQENLWGAMEFLSGEVRRAGYGFGGCPPDSTLGYDAPVVKMLDGSTSGTAPNVKVSQLISLDVDNNSNLFSGAIDGTDSLTLSYAVDDTAGALTGVRTTEAEPNATQAYLTVNHAGSITKDDLVVIWQHGSTKHCLLVQITGPPAGAIGAWTLPYASGNIYNPPAPSHTLLFPVAGGYLPGTLVMRVGDTSDQLVHYFAIDDGKGKRPPRLVTWSTANKSDMQVVADGIEDMQIAWACDVDGNGLLAEGSTATEKADITKDEWAYNTINDNLPDCATQGNPIRAVRITLVGRTTGPMTSRDGFRPASEDHAAGTPAQDLASTGQIGTFGRATLTSVIKPRNIARSVQ